MIPRVSVAAISGSPVVDAGLAGMLASSAETVEFVRGWEPGHPTDHGLNVVLVDVATPDHVQLDGPLLRRLSNDPSVRFVTLYTSFLPDVLRQSAKRFGIRSFLSKSLSGAELAQALLRVSQGHVVDHFTSRTRDEPRFGVSLGLTERESQVLVLCAQGLSNREIGDALYISPETVRTHMKGAYARLGIRNRVEATAFVRSGRIPAQEVTALPASSEESDTTRDGTVRNPEPQSPSWVPVEVIVDEADLQERLRLAGVDVSVRHRLRLLSPFVLDRADEIVKRIAQKWTDHGPASAGFAAMPELNLDQFTESYINQLFNEDFDRLHAEQMLATGAAHHRLQMAPQWLIASFAFYITEFIDTIFDNSATTSAAIESVASVVSSVFFDAGLVLDAYEICVERAILRQVAQTQPKRQPPSKPEGDSERSNRPLNTSHVLLQVPFSPDEVSVRRSFLELGDEEQRLLKRVDHTIRTSIASVLDTFYVLVAGSTPISELVPDEVADRLRSSVGRYWTNLADEQFDPVRAASRMRIGVIHETIGLQPQYYLAGLACQVNGLLRALPTDSPTLRAEISAIIRVVFFDATFVLDAYMDARAKKLLQIGRYAGQVVAGLANGVVIVDSRDRVEYANKHLLDLLGIDAGVLHRLPIDRALPMPGIRDLLQIARADAQGRASALHDAWGRRLRVTAIRLKESSAGRSGLLAIVVDDISDILRAESEQAHERRRNEDILAAVDAMVWEIDAESLTVLAISKGSLAVTGIRDFDLVGQQFLVDRLGNGDRTALVDIFRSMQEGDRRAIDHEIRHDNGSTVSVRTSLVATRSSIGIPTISGVTVANSPLPSRGATGSFSSGESISTRRTAPEF